MHVATRTATIFMQQQARLMIDKREHACEGAPEKSEMLLSSPASPAGEAATSFCGVLLPPITKQVERQPSRGQPQQVGTPRITYKSQDVLEAPSSESPSPSHQSIDVCCKKQTSLQVSSHNHARSSPRGRFLLNEPLGLRGQPVENFILPVSKRRMRPVGREQETATCSSETYAARGITVRRTPTADAKLAPLTSRPTPKRPLPLAQCATSREGGCSTGPEATSPDPQRASLQKAYLEDWQAFLDSTHDESAYRKGQALAKIAGVSSTVRLKAMTGTSLAHAHLPSSAPRLRGAAPSCRPPSIPALSVQPQPEAASGCQTPIQPAALQPSQLTPSLEVKSQAYEASDDPLHPFNRVKPLLLSAEYDEPQERWPASVCQQEMRPWTPLSEG